MPSFTVKITDLHKSGPIVEVNVFPSKALTEILKEKKEPIPKSVKVLAMIDTGATSSVIKPEIITQMGLNPIGLVDITTPSCENYSCYQYQAAIGFNAPGFPIVVETSELIAAPLKGQHIQCLIGRDILRFGVFVYNGPTEMFTLSI